MTQILAPSPPKSASRRLSPNQVYANNAPAPLTITTPDATGQVVEPAVEYVEGGWNGHEYWALITGYASSNDQVENPALYYSDDGLTFTPQPGVSFPIVGPPSGGYNDDPEIVLGPDNKLHLFWIVTTTAGTAPTNRATVAWCTYDGTTLSAVTQIGPTFDRTVEAPIAPCFMWDALNNQWVVWYTDIVNVINAVTATNAIKRRTIPGTSPAGTWSAATVCTVNGLSASVAPWEAHIAQRGSQLCMVTTTAPYKGNTTQGMVFGVSNDGGLTWTFGSNPLLSPSGAGWDQGGTSPFTGEDGVYRGDIVPRDDASGAVFDLWYSGVNASNVWRMGYTQIRVDPPGVSGVGGVASAGGRPLGVYGGIGANGLPVASLAAWMGGKPVAPYVYGDTVVRADNAAAIGNADSGQAYTVDAGVPGVLAGRIYATTTANTKARVALTGVADGVFTAELAVADNAAGVSSLMTFRYQDTNNFLGFGWVKAQGGYVLEQIITGSTFYSVLATASAPANGDVLAVRAQGAALAFYLNGQLIGRRNTTIAQTASAMGVHLAGSTTAGFRNLSARPLVGGF